MPPRSRAALAVLMATLAAAAAPPPAAADEPTPARRQATRSTTLYVGSELSPLPTIGAVAGVEAAVRAVRRGGLTFEGRAGGAFAFSAVARGALYGVRGGGGAGWSLPITPRMLLAPMVQYDLFVLWDSTATPAVDIHRLTGELSLSTVIYPHVVVDARVQVGAVWIDGNRDLALAIGPRIGVVF